MSAETKPVCPSCGYTFNRDAPRGQLYRCARCRELFRVGEGGEAGGTLHRGATRGGAGQAHDMEDRIVIHPTGLSAPYAKANTALGPMRPRRCSRAIHAVVGGVVVTLPVSFLGAVIANVIYRVGPSLIEGMAADMSSTVRQEYGPGLSRSLPFALMLMFLVVVYVASVVGFAVGLPLYTFYRVVASLYREDALGHSGDEVSTCGKCKHFKRTGMIDRYKGMCTFYDATTYSTFTCLATSTLPNGSPCDSRTRDPQRTSREGRQREPIS